MWSAGILVGFWSRDVRNDFAKESSVILVAVAVVQCHKFGYRLNKVEDVGKSRMSWRGDLEPHFGDVNYS